MKTIGLIIVCLGLAFSAQAFEKKQVKLSTDFWGKWTVFNAKTQCSETYQFNSPNQFIYSAKQKKLTGEFAVLRNQDPKVLDLLVMNVKTDNQQAGCSAVKRNYGQGKLNLSLKWVSAQSAELCTDREAKKCTGLYLMKQK